MEYLFRPSVTRVGRIQEVSSVEMIEAEPMLYDCDWHVAAELGGFLTSSVMGAILRAGEKEFYDMLYADDLHAHIDTKSVMLMPQFYPCIGGWHCDTVPRATGTSQPNLSLMREDIFHYLCVIPSTPNLSNTEFVMDDMIIDVDENLVWRSVNRAVDTRDKMTMRVGDGDVMRFSQSSIHRGMPATGHGWRYFFRLTFTEKEPQNKIRHQVQVYTAPDTSW